MNARYRRKISRMVRQILDQEEKKGGRQRWEWENLRKEGGAENNSRARNSASNDCSSWNRSGNLSIGTGHESKDVNRDVRDCNNVLSSASRGPAQPRRLHEMCDECSRGFNSLNLGCMSQF